ncbi:MAG: 4Fe-4S binding protein [Desulforegulaceae bacterium]|jgi:NAD-dependent dihydropyrimidine dehydrogenase PreA subunit|nr:4Fe-4S binding protein [Desulforegulaceae bacterium]
MSFNPIVDQDKCTGCEECVDICPVDVYEIVDGKSTPVNAEECVGCESCVEVCPEGAISIEEA